MAALLSVLWLACPLGAWGQADDGGPGDATVARLAARARPGELLVKFKDVPRSRAGSPFNLDENALPEAALRAAASIGATVVKTYSHVGVSRVTLPDDRPRALSEAAEALLRSGAVVYAVPNYRNELHKVPDDPRFKEQWGLHNTGQWFYDSTLQGKPDADVDGPEAWDLAVDAGETVVVVIDTGIDYQHEDLKDNMWTNPGEIPGDGIDNDGNGYVDDIYGINTWRYDFGPTDLTGHGTHCAGIIGARGDNGKGVAGVAWKARLLSCNAYDPDLIGGGVLWDSDVVECMNYSIGVKEANSYPRMVVNASWGTTEFSRAVYDGVASLERAGILVVAAAGNSLTNADIFPHYPSGFELDNIISVGASDHKDEIALFSNTGQRSVDLFAPGLGILSTLPFKDTRYGYYEGTSMAAPFVTGTCALLWSKHPQASWRAVKGMVFNGTEKGLANAFVGQCFTAGRLNLERSLKLSGDEPALLSVKPNPAWFGEKVTIRGVNLGTAPGQVQFGSAVLPSESILSWGEGAISVRLPADLPCGFDDLTVQTAGGQTTRTGFGVSRMPTVVGSTLTGHSHAANAQVGDWFWILSGENDLGQTALVERYHLKEQVSEVDPEWMIPTPTTYAGAAAVGEKIYVVGGRNDRTGKVLDLLQIFDTVTKIWSYGKPLPEPVGKPAVASLGGKIYVFGGVNPERGLYKVLGTTYVYDPAQNVWSSKAVMPSPVAYGAGVKVGSDRIWVIGGYNCFGVEDSIGCERNTVQEYNIKKNTWKSMPSLEKPRGGSAVAKCGNVWCLQGTSDLPYVGRKDGEVYRKGGWQVAFRNQHWWDTIMAAVSGRNIYLLGGVDPVIQDIFNRDVFLFRGY